MTSHISKGIEAAWETPKHVRGGFNEIDNAHTGQGQCILYNELLKDSHMVQLYR